MYLPTQVFTIPLWQKHSKLFFSRVKIIRIQPLSYCLSQRQFCGLSSRLTNTSFSYFVYFMTHLKLAFTLKFLKSFLIVSSNISYDSLLFSFVLHLLLAMYIQTLSARQGFNYPSYQQLPCLWNLLNNLLFAIDLK